MDHTEQEERCKDRCKNLLFHMDSVLKIADHIEHGYPHYDLDTNYSVEYVNDRYEDMQDLMLSLFGEYETDPTLLAAAVDDERFPVTQSTQQQMDDGHECAICLLNYSVGEMVRQLPCQHLFHAECLSPWLRDHVACPMCRKPLKDLEDFKDELKQHVRAIKACLRKVKRLMVMIASEYESE